MNLFDVDTNKLLALILTPLFTTLITRIFSRKTPGIYERERYEKVVFPVFDKLEPILYKRKLTREDLLIIEECRKLVFSHRQIAGGRMLHCFSLPAETMFRRVSRIVDSEFDLCAKKLGLSKRPTDYRINRSDGVQVILVTFHLLRVAGSVLLVILLAICIFAFLVHIL